MGLTHDQRVSLLTDYCERVCAQDDECYLLRQAFMRIFREDVAWDEWYFGCGEIGFEPEDQEDHACDQMDGGKRQFEYVYSLVYRVSKRLDVLAVQSVWMHCCYVELMRWAEHFELEKSPPLQYLIRCWLRYRNALSRAHSLSLYAKPFLAMKQIFCSFFVDHLLTSAKMKNQVFQAIVTIMNQNNVEDQQVNIARFVLKLLLYLDEVVFYRVFALPYLKLLQDSTQQCQPQMKNATEVISYLKKVETEIGKQVDKANLYRFPVALVRMVGKLLFSKLIAQHRDRICGYQSFLQLVQPDCSQLDQLGYLFRIISYDAEGVNLMADNVKQHLYHQLNSIRGLEMNSVCGPEQVVHFVSSLLQLQRRWLSQLTTQVFNYNTTIRQAMVSSMAKYINSQPVHVCTLSVMLHLVSLDQLPAIGILCDLPLAQCRQAIIDQVSKLVSLVEDKQVLAEQIRYFLCHRIVLQVSFHLEEDLAQICRLMSSFQIESQFGANLLLKDYKSSLLELDSQKVHPRVDLFQVRALNASFWKIDTELVTQTYRLPRSFWCMFNSFRANFAAKNPKKTLHLNRNYGSSQLVAHFNAFRIKYQFVASLRQTVILSTFNKHPDLSFERLKSITKMDDDSLLQCLRVFRKYGLVLARSETYHLEFDDGLTMSSFSINDQFKAEAIEVKGSVQVCPDGVLQVDWVRLQYVNSFELKLSKLLTVAGSDEHVKGKQTQAGGNQTRSVETNLNEHTVRVEAAVVRVLKRVKTVADLATLHTLTLEALRSTKWAASLSPQVLVNALAPAELDSIVHSLHNNGYLKRLPGGQIVYEP